MDRKFVLTAAALAFVVAGSVAVGTRLPKNTPADPLFENIAGVERPDIPKPEVQEAPQEPEYAYLVREYEGRVAVFPYSDLSEPHMVLDTLVKYLPDYDRSQIAEGIPVKNDRELVALIEDFIS